jgi:hypothetical protein
MAKVIDFDDSPARPVIPPQRSASMASVRPSAHDRLRRRLGQIERLNADQAELIDGLFGAFLHESPTRHQRHRSGR